MLKKTRLLALAVATLLAGCAPKIQNQIVSTPAIAAEPPGPELHAEDFVAVQTLTSNHFLRADKSGDIDVRVRLTAKPRTGGKRPPINLGLVVDTSGSMEGAAIENARAASLALLDSLSPGDRLAVVVFHSTTEVLVPSTKLTKENMVEIRGKLGAIKANGTTDLAGGLGAGLAEVTSHLEAQGINRVVLLGDGIPNDPNPLQSLAQQAANQRVSITALGLGLDYDETLMSQLALTSGGKYHFIRESSAVAKVFTDEVLRLKEVVGRGMALTLSPGPGVVVKDVIGLPSSRSGQKTSVVIGDLSEGDERDVVVRLSVPGRKATSVVELLDAEVAFDAPAGGKRLSSRAFVGVKATADLAELEQGRERDVERSAARVSVADAIVRAVAAARGGNVQLAQSILDNAEKDARAAAKELEDDELAEKAKSIAPLRKSLPTLAPAPVATVPPGVPPQGGRPMAMPSTPMPAMPPDTAVMVMKTQAAAMSTIQGN